jgi:hypothetical protein
MKAGWCEIEDADAPDKPVDLYMVWTATTPKTPMWLCREHAALLIRPPLLPGTGDSGRAGLLTESQRFQVQEARDCLGTWDLNRAPGVISRESVLADQVRNLLAIIDAVAPVTGEEPPDGT